MAIFSPTIDYFLPVIGEPHYGFAVYLTQAESWIVIVWMGVGSGFIGVISYYYLVQKMGAEKALTSNYLVPVIGSLIGLFYFGEWHIYTVYDYIFQIGGTLIVVFGLVLCSMDGLKKRKEPRKPKVSKLTSKVAYASLPTTSDTESGIDFTNFPSRASNY